jgi:DNA-binding transcriptional ArsR family regulator
MRSVIQVRLSVSDLGRMHFAYSPLAEVGESLYMLSSGRIHPVHREWFKAVRPRLTGVDMALLRAVVPPRSYIASFLFIGASDPATTIDNQLQLLAQMQTDELGAELAAIWRGETMPVALQELVSDRASGAQRLADCLWTYWSIAVEPHWRSMRAILDEDVAHRASDLTKDGVNSMMGGLHEQVSIHDEVLRIHKLDSAHEDLSGCALKLVPSVFVWPNLIFCTGTGSPTLTYPARGVGKLWENASDSAASSGTVIDDSLAMLLGRSRAAILVSLALAQSTTELSLRLGQSPPAVSQHLSVLRRSGLVASWRSGRSVMYRRTALATSIIEASDLASPNAATVM